jgi:hypothetical protein
MNDFDSEDFDLADIKPQPPKVPVPVAPKPPQPPAVKKPNLFEQAMQQQVQKQQQAPVPATASAQAPASTLSKPLLLQFSSYSGSLPFFEAWITTLKSFELSAPNESLVRVDSKKLHDIVNEIYLKFQFQFEISNMAIPGKQPYEVFAEAFNLTYPEYVQRRWSSVSQAAALGNVSIEYCLAQLLVPADAFNKALTRIPNYTNIEYSLKSVASPDVKKLVHVMQWHTDQGVHWNKLTKELLISFTSLMQGMKDDAVQRQSAIEKLLRFSADPGISERLRTLIRRVSTNDNISKSLQAGMGKIYNGGAF